MPNTYAPSSNDPIIPGLVTIQVRKDSPNQPSVIPDSELKAMAKRPDSQIPFFKESLLLSNPQIQAALLSIQAHAQFFADTGRNDSLVGIEDFRIAAIKSKTDRSNPVVNDAPTLVFMHRRTGKYVIVAAWPAPGWDKGSFHSASITGLVEASVPDPQ